MKNTNTRNALYYISILVFLVLIDQITKEVAIRTMKGQPAQVYAGGMARLEYAENTGAFLGLGGEMDPTTRFWIFVVGAGALTAFMGYFVLRGEGSSVERIGMTLAVGGGISNLIDRIARDNGHVVDFMNVGIGSLRTGIFNIADMGIMAGVVLVFVAGLKK